MHRSCSDGHHHERRRKMRGGAARPAAADERSGAAAVVPESSASSAVSSLDPDSTRMAQNHLPAAAVGSRLPFFPRISGTAPSAAVCLLKMYFK